MGSPMDEKWLILSLWGAGLRKWAGVSSSHVNATLCYLPLRLDYVCLDACWLVCLSVHLKTVGLFTLKLWINFREIFRGLGLATKNDGLDFFLVCVTLQASKVAEEVCYIRHSLSVCPVCCPRQAIVVSKALRSTSIVLLQKRFLGAYHFQCIYSSG